MNEKIGEYGNTQNYIDAGFALLRKGRSLIARYGQHLAGDADRARGKANLSPVEAVNAWIRQHNGGKIPSAPGG